MTELTKSFTFKPIESFLFLFIIALSVGLLTTPYAQFALLIGPVVLLLFFLGRYPQIGYYLIVFMIPFSTYTALPAYAELFSLPRFVGFWLVFIIVFTILLNKKNTFNFQSNFWPWFFFFFISGLFSALVSEYTFTSFDNLRILFFIYIFFIMNLIFISHYGFSKVMPAVIILSVFISSLLSVIGFLFDLPIFAMNLESEANRRAIGLVGDPNDFSSVIIFTLPLLAWWFFTSSNNLKKFIITTFFLINIYAITLTRSRGGGIALAITLFLLFIEHMRRFRPKLTGFVTLFLGVAIAMVIIFVPASYWERQKSVTDIEEDSSLGGRAAFVYAAWDAFRENPIMGKGPGTFKEYYAGTDYARKFESRSKSQKRAAHNAYIEVLVGQGIVGLFIYIVIILLALKNFNIAQKRFQISGQKEIALLVGAYRISFISICIIFLVLSLQYHKYFWVSLALSQIALRLSQEKAGRAHNQIKQNLM